jgi:Zn-dependent protease with chaperone function
MFLRASSAISSTFSATTKKTGPGIGYMVTVFVEIVFGILASIIVMYFSRQREYRADAGAAALMGSKVPMMNALRRLGGLQSDGLPQNLQASGISGRESWLGLFSSHRRWSRASPPCRLHADAMLADRTAPVRPASGGTCVAVMPAYSRAC